MARPLLLDLFCGAGGAAMGYHRSGFDVVGVDLFPQPRYPFEFIRADAMTYPWTGFDVIHASPPCQPYTSLVSLTGAGRHPALVETVRRRLKRSGLPWVIENVPGAPLREPLVLCGTEFSLCVRNVLDGQRRWLRRHRLFESNVDLPAASGCHCAGLPVAGIYGHGGGAPHRRGWQCSAAEARILLGVDWMTRDELAQAIPPAYTEYVGRWLRTALTTGVEACGRSPCTGTRTRPESAGSAR